MKLTVIILNYNVQYFLEQCIVSVQRATDNMDAEIIVVDNNSPDDSCAMVKARFPSIALIENKENLGFSKANNQAVQIAKGDFVCILNPDTAVAEDTFLKAIAQAEAHENLGALGIYLMDGTGNFLPESKRNVPTPKTALMKLMGLSGRSNYYAKQPSEMGQGAVPALVGAFMLLKRSVYEEVGGFDEDYFMYGEDLDLSYKLSKAGYQNYYFGNIKTLHYKGESTCRDRSYYKRFYGAMRIFYRKHFTRNFFMNTLIYLGVLFVKTNGNSHSPAPSRRKNPKKAYIFTENFSLLKRLSETMDMDVQNASKSILADTTYFNTLFIFDVDYMSYSQIFMVMHEQKNKGNIFRIRPQGCNFILGSDRSDQKGTVLTF